MNHFDDPFACGVGCLGSLAVGCWDRGSSWKCHAHGFGQAVHRKGRPHDVAVTGAGSRGG